MGQKVRAHTVQCFHVYKFVDQKSSAIILVVKCSAGVAPEANLKNPSHVSEEACKARQTSPEVQNMSISDPTKKD